MSQCFVALGTWCVWRLALQAGLQEIISDAQNTFVRSLGAFLYFKSPSWLWENNPSRNSTSWGGLYFKECGNWWVFVGTRSWSGNAAEDQIHEVQERGNHSLSTGLVGSLSSVHFLLLPSKAFGTLKNILAHFLELSSPMDKSYRMSLNSLVSYHWGQAQHLFCGIFQTTHSYLMPEAVEESPVNL